MKRGSRSYAGIAMALWLVCGSAAAWAGPAQDQAAITELLNRAGTEVLEKGNTEAFVNICTDDVVFRVREQGEETRVEGKQALRDFLNQNPLPPAGQRPGQAPAFQPDVRVAIIGDEAVALVDYPMPARPYGFVRAVMRWTRTPAGWRCTEYCEADIEPGLVAARSATANTWPAQPGAGLPVPPEECDAAADLAENAARQLAQTPGMRWCNTRVVTIRPDGSGTTVAATLHVNTGGEPLRTFGYNTSVEGEERVYDGRGNKLEVRKSLRNPNSPGRYRVEIRFMEPVAPGAAEVTFTVASDARVIEEKAGEWVFTWRNIPGNACLDTCRVRYPATFEVLGVSPQTTEEAEPTGMRSVTWQTRVAEGGRVQDMIRFRKP